MNPEIVKWFNEWFLSNEERLKQNGLKVTYAEKSEKYPELFQWVDIESSDKVGNVIVYDVGTCDTTILEIDTSKHLESSATFINSQDEMEEFLEKFILSLQIQMERL